MTTECTECEARATRSGPMGDPLCERHWRDAGLYDPDQGFEPTLSDREAFRRARGEERP